MEPAHTQKRTLETQSHPSEFTPLKKPKMEPDLDDSNTPPGDGIYSEIPRIQGPIGPARWLGSRDWQFWYPDGNVVITLEGTLFKLHRSRLERYCHTFAELFASRPDGDETITSIDGCPAYAAPPGLSLQGFKDVLAALEEPLHRIGHRPSQSEAISVLRASHVLQSWQTTSLAQTWLKEIWEAHAFPGDARSYEDAIRMVQLSRQFKIPGVLKRAFYELVSSHEFWGAVAADIACVDLREEDITVLLKARLWLAEKWQDFLFVAPTTERTGRPKCEEWMRGNGQVKICGIPHDEGRDPSWAWSMVKGGHLKLGALDPLRYNVVERGEEDLKLAWCDACLQTKEDEWKDKRVEWWGQLDGLFKLDGA